LIFTAATQHSAQRLDPAARSGYKLAAERLVLAPSSPRFQPGARPRPAQATRINVGVSRTMATVSYRLNVDHLILNAATGSSNIVGSPIQQMIVNLDYVGGTPFSAVFDGFTLKLLPAGPQNCQIGFELSKPGHPMNGNTGIAWGTIMISHATAVFGEYELTIPVSNTEKYAIRLDKI
jgi:hypothetical protein